MNRTVYIFSPTCGYLDGHKATGVWEWVPKIKNDNAWGFDLMTAKRMLELVRLQHPDAVLHSRKGKTLCPRCGNDGTDPACDYLFCNGTI